MKSNFILTFLVLFFTVNCISQTKSEVIFVDGVCGMCEKRIEKAALSVKGVKLANWDIPSNQISLIYNPQKVDLATIHKSIAAEGYDTSEAKAKKEDYNEPVSYTHLTLPTILLV